MTVTGGCGCGRIRFEATGMPGTVTVCHCADCRRATGSPMVGWLTVRRQALRFLVEVPKSFASSPGITRSFCPNCGTPLTYRRDGGEEVDITIGSLDDPNGVRPADHLWTDHQVDWVKLCDGLPRHRRARDAK